MECIKSAEPWVVGYFDSDEKDHGCLSFDALAKLAYSG
jgi:hypothetical protein